MGERRNWCKHYNGMSGHTTCLAGVEYAKFKAIPMKPETCPCWAKQDPSPCEKAEYRNAEEIADEEREMHERLENLGKARMAIVDHLGPWKRGMPGVGGAIPCPVCGTGCLRFSRAGVNGHIHAGCTTAKCVRWME